MSKFKSAAPLGLDVATHVVTDHVCSAIPLGGVCTDQPHRVASAVGRARALL